MTQVTALGFLRDRLDQRLAELQANYQAIYGQDVQIDSNSPDGQWIGTLADRFSDLDQLAEDVYNSFNPQTATGVALSRLVQLNRIKRGAGQFSLCVISCGGSPNTIIPAGSQVKSTVDGSLWQTTGDVLIPIAGTVDATFECTVMGPTAAAIGTLTKINTPIYGWQTATNAAAATPGTSVETDEELRVRRAASTGTPGQGITDALYGALSNLPGVRLVRVYENYTDATDANGQQKHSIYCVVEGGVDLDIANTIWEKRSAGVTMLGSTAVTVTDVQGLPHPVNFGRPAYTNAYITVNVTKRTGYPSNGTAQIQAALVAAGLAMNIGDPLLDTRLYTPINTVPNHFITSVAIGTAPSPVGTTNITVPYDGLIKIDTSRIVVNET